MSVMPILGMLLFSDKLNTLLWKALGCRVGRGSIIRKGTEINVPFMLTIGKNSKLHGKFLCRGGIEIGNNVEFVNSAFVSTQKHNLNSALFENVYNPITIKDECWISLGCIILDGVTLEEGTVLAAGAVLTKSTESWSVMGGVPAKHLSTRTVIDRKKIDIMRIEASKPQKVN
jgi:putative colanic acid biosynthesis acetyltransferase WcaF